MVRGIELSDNPLTLTWKLLHLIVIHDSHHHQYDVLILLGSGQKATMAHLRAAQRWDALRMNVMKAVRRQRVINQEKITSKTNRNLDHHRLWHLVGLFISAIVTAICIVVPLALQDGFSDRMTESQDLRKLTHAGTMVKLRVFFFLLQIENII